MEAEVFRCLGLVEGQIGRADLEHLAAHAPTARRKPPLLATGNDQLDLLGQEIEQQVERVTAVERSDLVEMVQHDDERLVDGTDRSCQPRHDPAQYGNIG